MPLVAAFALHLFAALKLHSVVPRFAVGLMLTPAALSIATISIANAAGLDDRETFNRPEREVCLKTASYAPLASLPKGLIAADTDYGPFLLALTPHSVLAAPYHRLSAGILAAHKVFAAAPDEARRMLTRLGVTYVITAARARRATCRTRLRAGCRAGTGEERADWLEPVAGTAPFRLYRLRS